MEYIKLIGKGLVLLLVLIVNHLHFFNVFHPEIYVLFLLCLPLQMPRWAEMLVGAGIGLIMDLFYSSLGMHIAACVLVSYLRPLLLHRAIQEPERIMGEVTAAKIGMEAYMKIGAILIFLHQAIISILDAWSWSAAGWTMLTIVLSAGVTIGVMFVYEVLRT